MENRLGSRRFLSNVKAIVIVTREFSGVGQNILRNWFKSIGEALDLIHRGRRKRYNLILNTLLNFFFIASETYPTALVII